MTKKQEIKKLYEELQKLELAMKNQFFETIVEHSLLMRKRELANKISILAGWK